MTGCRQTESVAGPLVLKQVHSVVDGETTELCLDAAGQIRRVDEPFETLNGQFDAPPFHIHCRAHITPWMPGFVSDERQRANAELRRRRTRHKRKSAAGWEGRRQPPPPTNRVAPTTVVVELPTPIQKARRRRRWGFFRRRV